MSVHTQAQDGLLYEDLLFDFSKFEIETGGFEEYAPHVEVGDGALFSTLPSCITLDFGAEAGASVQLSIARGGASVKQQAILNFLKELTEGPTPATTTTTPTTSSSADTGVPVLPLPIVTSTSFAMGDPLSGGQPPDDQPHPTPNLLDATTSTTTHASPTFEPPKSPSKHHTSHHNKVLVQSTRLSCHSGDYHCVTGQRREEESGYQGEGCGR